MRVLLILVLLVCVAFGQPCPNCATEVDKQWKFCPKCGASMPDQNAAVDEAAAAADAQKTSMIEALQKLKDACEKAGQTERIAKIDALLKALKETKLVDSANVGPKVGGLVRAGGGGKFAWRLKDHESLLNHNGGSALTDAAVLSGLKWLARHQDPDGSWSPEGFVKQCGGTSCAGVGYNEYRAAMTGLSILALLGSGYLPDSNVSFVDPFTKKTIVFGDVLDRGLKWLLQFQATDGGFTDRRTSKYMYSHAVATIAMIEAFGMTANAKYEESAKRAIQFLQDAANPGRGWRYSVRPGDNDTSVTGWCVMALKSAQACGLTVSDAVLEGSRIWLEMATDPTSFKVGYTARGTGKVVVQGKNESWEGHEALTAVGMVCHLVLDPDRAGPAIAGGTKMLLADLPAYEGLNIDYYYWYYGTLALFHTSGADATAWKTWNEAMKKALLPSQIANKDSCEAGSWDPAIDRWGFEGGRVYATALNVLTLETYYRYEKGFTKKK